MAGQWYYTVNRQQQGPVNWDDLYRLARSGTIQPADMIWQEGMPNWTKANTTPGLFDDPGSGGRRADDDEAPRRSRSEDADRPRRGREGEDNFDDDRGGRKPRRLPKEGGMPVGLKVGLIVGGVVVGLLIVGVVLILIMRGGETTKGPFAAPVVGGTLTKNDLLRNSDGTDTVMRSPCHVYLITMTGGRTYTIDLESNAFDSYLRIENSNRIELNSDGGGKRNAHIVFTPPFSGTYRVIATSVDNRRGNYTLRIREGNQFNNVFPFDK